MDQQLRDLPGRCGSAGSTPGDNIIIHIKKKREETDRDHSSNEKSEPIGIERVTIAGIDRGLTVDAIRRMELGQLLDYCEEWNRIHDQSGEDNKKETVHKRKATQADWDAFFA